MSDNRGRSSLGLCHPRYDVRGFIESFNQSTVMRFGWLDKFFNAKDSRNAITALRVPKQKFCRVHIINGPGLNNSRVQPHEITYGYTHSSLVRAIQQGDEKFLRKYRNRCEKLQGVLDHAPAGTLELCVSPWLERQPIPEEVFKRLAHITSEYFPGAPIVDNPVRGGFIPGFVRESHNLSIPASGIDIFDLDGIDMETIDVVTAGKKFENSKCFYGWGLTENGNSKDGPWLPPEKRVNFPSAREHKMYAYFLSPNALEIAGTVYPGDIAGLKLYDPTDGWKNDFVWKLGDRRSYGVALLPRSFNSHRPTTATLRNKGRVVDTGKVRGRYTEDGSNRWIIDFTKHTASLPDNSVLVIDSKHGWVLEKPQFRVD